MRETTALGAAVAAGFAIGVWNDTSELRDVNTQGRTVFEPQIGNDERDRMFARWGRAVDMCRGWLDVDEAVKDN